MYAKALSLRDRLGPRDALKLDAAVARLGPAGPAIEKTRQLLQLYPDELGAHLALGQMELWERNDLAQALQHARAAAAPQSERRAAAHYLQGIILVGMEKPREALAEFEKSRALGFRGWGYMYAYAHGMQRDWAGTERVLAQRVPTASATLEALLPANLALVAADRGRWDEAVRQAREATRAATAAEPLYRALSARIAGLAIDVAAGRESRAELLQRIDAELDWLDANRARLDGVVDLGSIWASQALGYLAARLDAGDRVQRALGFGDAARDALEYSSASQMRTILLAEQERIAGTRGPATDNLARLASSGHALVLVHSSLMRSLRAAGDDEGALEQARWIASHRGRAYVERATDEMLTVMGLVDTTLAHLVQAEIAADRGDTDEASRRLAGFTAAWAADALPGALRARVARLQARSVSGP